MLAATSVGITARVLADAGASQTKAARIILGAAVIDDVLGLIVLAVPRGPRRVRPDRGSVRGGAGAHGGARGEPSLETALAPLAAFLVPVFFVRMERLVDVSAFASWPVVAFALVLTAAAVLGKQVCGLVAPPGVSGLAIGIGMMPRGGVASSSRASARSSCWRGSRWWTRGPTPRPCSW